MTDYSAQVKEEYEAVEGVIERRYADVIQVKLAGGGSKKFTVAKNIIRLRIGHPVVVITRKGSDAAAVVLNRATGKTVRIECGLAGTAMSKYVAGLALYALGAVVFFSGLLPQAWAVGGGAVLFLAGLWVIVATPVRDDGAAAQAFEAFLDANWKAGPVGSTFTKGSALR